MLSKRATLGLKVFTTIASESHRRKQRRNQGVECAHG